MIVWNSKQNIRFLLKLTLLQDNFLETVFSFFAISSKTPPTILFKLGVLLNLITDNYYFLNDSKPT